MKTNNLFLIVKKQYFEEIKSGIKTKEYKLATDYFSKKLIGRNYRTVTFQNVYSANSEKLVLEYKGVDLEYFQCEFFGQNKVLVFSIALGEIINGNKF